MMRAPLRQEGTTMEPIFVLYWLAGTAIGTSLGLLIFWLTMIRPDQRRAAAWKEYAKSLGDPWND
jgi:hypothetical protein